MKSFEFKAYEGDFFYVHGFVSVAWDEGDCCSIGNIGVHNGSKDWQAKADEHNRRYLAHLLKLNQEEQLKELVAEGIVKPPESNEGIGPLFGACNDKPELDFSAWPLKPGIWVVCNCDECKNVPHQIEVFDTVPFGPCISVHKPSLRGEFDIIPVNENGRHLLQDKIIRSEIKVVDRPEEEWTDETLFADWLLKPGMWVAEDRQFFKVKAKGSALTFSIYAFDTKESVEEWYDEDGTRILTPEEAAAHELKLKYPVLAPGDMVVTDNWTDIVRGDAGSSVNVSGRWYTQEECAENIKSGKWKRYKESPL